jgi:hypothetical protein
MSRLALISLALPLALAAAGASAQSSSSDKDPAAMAALERIGAALAKKMEVNVHADITAEDVLLSGQKVQYGGTVEIFARRPNNLRMSLKMGPSSRELYYDGKTLTMDAPSLGLYASADAPPTIKETLEMAQEKYGLEVPLADLFMWSSRPDFAAQITSAFPAGRESIGGFTCEHYALRHQDVDWQVWIREGEDALPCKLVITMTDDPAMPQFSAVYRWSDDPPPGPEAFAFKPPQNSSPITFGMVKTASKQEKK